MVANVARRRHGLPDLDWVVTPPHHKPDIDSTAEPASPDELTAGIAILAARLRRTWSRARIFESAAHQAAMPSLFGAGEPRQYVMHARKSSPFVGTLPATGRLLEGPIGHIASNWPGQFDWVARVDEGREAGEQGEAALIRLVHPTGVYLARARGGELGRAHHRAWLRRHGWEILDRRRLSDGTELFVARQAP